MDITRLEKRNTTLDIIRIFALTTVLSVHFFLHTGFYSEVITGLPPIEGMIQFITSGDPASLHGFKIFIMVGMRTFLGICVPLFMLLTGWLMSEKKLSRSYYKGIRKTLIVFALVSVACIAFKSVHDLPDAKDAFLAGDFDAMFSAIAASGKYDLKHYILGIFDFTGANYSWYIEMYIGLFLIAPFLNLIYHNLKTKRRKQALILTFLFITVIPTVLNIFNFESATWWTAPVESTTYQKFIPTFWMGIYPVTYYFTGMYLREYGLKLKTRTIAILLGVMLLLFTGFNIYRCSGKGFTADTYGYWYGFEPYVLSVLMFTLLSRIRSNGWNVKVRFGLWKISDLVLGAFLLSFISDSIIYDKLTELVPVMEDRLAFFGITVILSLAVSLAGSFLVNMLAALLIKAYEVIKRFVLSERQKQNGRLWQDVLFLTLFLGVILVSIWKVRYGFGGSDESFYLTIPHRLSMGDALFRDEWNLAQLSGIFLTPFVWAYTTITGSGTGIVLAARILYIIVHAGASFLIYTRLRKYGVLSVFCTIFYFLFTPYDIMALSYNTMGLELIVLAGVFIGTADYSKRLWIILSGLCFAGAVLCSPYLIIVYPLYGLLMLVHLILRKKELRFTLKSKMFAPRTFLFFTLGAGIMLAVFMVFTLTRVSIGEIFTNLPYMLKDPQHPSIPLLQKIKTYFDNIFNTHELFKYVLFVFGAELLALTLDKKRRKHRSVYLVTAVGLSLFNMILYLPELSWRSYNSIMFPFIFVGVTAYILCEKKPRELFAGLFCLGILYSICIHLASNQYFYAISMALSASNVASFIFLGQALREMRESPDELTYAVPMKRICIGLIVLLLAVQGGFQLGAKIYHVFWEQEPKNLTAEITEGPAAGLYTSEQNAEKYNATYEDLKTYQDKDPDKILFMTTKTYCHLATANFPYGTYSAWLAGENASIVDRLKSFYELNPDKIPKYVYIPKDSEWDIPPILAEAAENGYTVTETANGYQLERVGS